MQHELAIATRFWGLAPDDVQRLTVWLDATLTVVPAEHVFVAVNVDADTSGSLAFMKEKYPRVTAFPVTPWGKVVQAPNALLLQSAEQEVTRLLFVSTEYPVTSSLASRLLSHLDSDTLVVGASLLGHAFKAQQGETVEVKEANGLEIPWNTYALWSLEHLIHTGFVLAADSLNDPDNAGMEEMGTIAAQQILWPGKATAKLIAPQEGDLVMNTHGWTIERRERYARNLESKSSRSAAQLSRLSLPTPTVLHIG